MRSNQIINLTIKQNSHRLVIALGNKITLFCSAQYKFFQGRIHIAGIIIDQLSAKLTVDQDVFMIDSIAAAKLINRLTKKTFQGSISFAAPAIQNKWDGRINFSAKDFE